MICTQLYDKSIFVSNLKSFKQIYLNYRCDSKTPVDQGVLAMKALIKSYSLESYTEQPFKE